MLPSPNGAAIASQAASGGQLVFAGCLRNASAVAGAVRALDSGPVLVIAAGERWPDGSLRPCAENLIGAGAILSRLDGSPSPEAACVIAAVNDGTARAALGGCESAIELIEQGFEADVHYAFDWDCSEAVPVIRRPARHFTAATA